MRSTAEELEVSSAASLLGDVDAINIARRAQVVDLAREANGGSLAGKRVAVLGVAFKPASDDVRDSPSLDVCERLMREGAIVSVHDPVATPNAARLCPDLRYSVSVSEAAEAADLVLHLTEWSAYQAIIPPPWEGLSLIASSLMLAVPSTPDYGAPQAGPFAYWAGHGTEDHHNRQRLMIE